MDDIEPWAVEARNLPEHAGNPIHTDHGARAAGFPSALVAGVTTYAYLTHPVVAAAGLGWLEHGGGEVRFRAPVFAGERVGCTPRHDTTGLHVDAVCPTQERNPRASLRVIENSGPPADPRPGEPLVPVRIALDDRYSHDYGWRAGDDLTTYHEAAIVHPAVWPAIANLVFAEQLVDGSWIHTRSIIRHHGVGPVGATVDVHGTVVDRFERHGERAVCDLVIELDGVPLVTIEHEAIVRLS